MSRPFYIQLMSKLSSISCRCRRWTRAMRYLTRIVMYTNVDAQCDKLTSSVKRRTTLTTRCYELC